MTKVELMNKASRAMHKVAFKFKKHSPEIMIVTGVVGVVTSAVMACKATTKLSEIMEEANNQIDEIKYAMEHPETVPATSKGEYTEEAGKHDLTITYAKTGFELFKLYAPAVGVGIASITMILAGHNITRKRLAVSTAAYTALDTAFKDYRGRLIERFGKDLDKELRYNLKTKEVEEVIVNEDGSETIVKKTVEEVDNPLALYSDYAKFFDASCPDFEKDPELNFMFLRAQERYANEQLKRKGYMFLNDVYELVGIPRTKAGQFVGWIYDDKNPEHDGDNFIDFGITDRTKEGSRLFVNGRESVILLDFNVDGPIVDLI